MYTAGVPLGVLVDAKGPRPGALLSAVLLGLGYFLLYKGMNPHMWPTSLISDTATAYDGGPGTISMPWLCIFSFLTGIGGCAAFLGAIKTCDTR